MDLSILMRRTGKRVATDRQAVSHATPHLASMLCRNTHNRTLTLNVRPPLRLAPHSPANHGFRIKWPMPVASSTWRIALSNPKWTGSSGSTYDLSRKPLTPASHPSIGGLTNQRNQDFGQAFFHNRRHPQEMGPTEVRAFPTRLAVNRTVSASIQNQALKAIAFMYREVARRDPRVFCEFDRPRCHAWPTKPGQAWHAEPLPLRRMVHTVGFTPLRAPSTTTRRTSRPASKRTGQST